MQLLQEHFCKEIKNRLDLHGIEIPYPRMVLYNREELVSEKQFSMERGLENGAKAV